MYLKAISAVLFSVGIFISGPLQAASIVTDDGVGGWSGGSGLAAPGNTFLHSAINALNTVTHVTGFEDASVFDGMDAVWVNDHFSGFSATEAMNVRDFVSAGHKAVIITDNSGWAAFNLQIETIIGATITDTCSSVTGTANAGHPLGVGVGTVNHLCGSVLDPAPHMTEIVSGGIAGLYAVGLGEVFVLTSVDQLRSASPAEPELVNNLAAFLADPITPPLPAVPLPASSALLLAGLAGLGVLRRRKTD